LSTVYFSLFSLFSLSKTAEKHSGLLPVSRCAFYTEPPPCQPLSEVFLKHFLQRFQAVIAQVSPLFSGLPSSEMRILQTSAEESTANLKKIQIGQNATEITRQ